ncbi:MAG: hypothetical protein ACKO9F_07160, partial [Caldilinea sp.]
MDENREYPGGDSGDEAGSFTLPAAVNGANGELPLTTGNVRNVLIEQEMRAAYLDYAMSVIVARALPDARDG